MINKNKVKALLKKSTDVKVTVYLSNSSARELQEMIIIKFYILIKILKKVNLK